jgi:hypothetical protein
MRFQMRAMSAVIAGALIIFSGSGQAHHSIGLEYGTDTGKIEGVVDEVFWSNPHSYIYVNVEDDDGSTKRWAVSIGIIQGLVRRGWSPDTVRRGDRLVATGLLGRNGTRRIRGERLTVTRDGETIVKGGQVVEQVRDEEVQ